MSTPPLSKPDLSLNKQVFLPSALLLIATVAYSMIDNEGFLVVLNGVHQWILEHFDWLFTWGSFLTFVIVVGIYFSPLRRRTIGRTSKSTGL